MYDCFSDDVQKLQLWATGIFYDLLVRVVGAVHLSCCHRPTETEEATRKCDSFSVLHILWG